MPLVVDPVPLVVDPVALVVDPVALVVDPVALVVPLHQVVMLVAALLQSLQLAHANTRPSLVL